MTGRTFGRRGINDGGAAVPRAFAGEPRARTFHPAREAAVDPRDDIAARRAAFLAGERARAAQPAQAEDFTPRPEAAPARPIFVREKSLAAAYVLWFFLGGLSVHRFYLGYPVSGALQLGLLVVSWSMAAAGQYAAFFGFIVCGLWLLVDGFMIAGLHRKANARAREAAACAFA